jgi:hypothetical protein
MIRHATTASHSLVAPASGWLLALSAAAAGCCPPGATQAAPQPAMTVAPEAPPAAGQAASAAPALARAASSEKPALAVPTSDQDLTALIEGRGCTFAAPSGRVACIEAPVEMGYVTMDLVVVDSTGERGRLRLYGDASMVLDAKAVNAEGFAAANALLAVGSFSRSGEAADVSVASIEGNTLAVVHNGAQSATALPALPKGRATTRKLDPHTDACCKWKPQRVWTFDQPHLAAVEIYRSCSWSREATAGVPKVCVDPETNPENYVTFSRVVVAPLE